MTRAALEPRRVLVTGGTGFIGGRLVERLAGKPGVGLRVLISDFARAARVARFDAELVRGDVADPDTVLRAAEGCDTIFHCAYGGRGSAAERHRITVEGTRAVLDAGLAVAARRVVHVSTMLVYGMGVEGDLDESAPRRRSRVAYADAKIEAEALALRYASEHGLPVSVIQPTTVYGPFGRGWTARVLDDLRTGRVILVDGGVGHANPVYVDDVVDALLAAAASEHAVGEAFLVSGGERVTWREFYGCFERMLGFTSTVSMPRDEAKAVYARLQRRTGVLRELVAVVREHPEVRRRIGATREVALVRRLLVPVMARRSRAAVAPRAAADTRPGGRDSRSPVHGVHPAYVDFLAATTVVRIDKARRLLGYEPRFDLARGMAMTERWARWANLLHEGAAP